MPRVVLVEDDPSVRDGVEMGLLRRGHDVLATATGEAGLEAVDTFRPDLLLLDLMLPGMDGVEVCRRVRARGQLPIIMLTARGDDVDIVVGLDAGADDYVVKPPAPRSSRPASAPCCAASKHLPAYGTSSNTTAPSPSTAPGTPSSGRASRSPWRRPS